MIPRSLTLPLGVNANGSLATTSGTDRIVQGVVQFFATPKGSRPLVPEFGYPELPGSKMFVPAWRAECEQALLLIDGIQNPKVLCDLTSDGRLVGTVSFTTTGKENLKHEFTLTDRT